ncbi:amino acid ABC transporter substrate-binding protein [Skermanella stibiiresistens SB22]|uniref:Amino acid ABC transporter substrate-binding protein n=1 Tax=Skermanella stibiiresistens SB22 TaxID=1385369 RepID=W9GY89_9PROT|nr:iron-siderophore ABC transporter substrate-binding protein [Skermanella stibiiresistens]EWY37576.1 amino acid ABC transporter substrate-binding protein [Skermanella stibiiresistens SB22]
MTLPTRRAVCAAALALLVPPVMSLPVAAAPVEAASRVAAVDWAMLETALALGVTPVAGTELVHYRRSVVTPAVPDEVADLGLRGAPNLEMLLRTAPDLILSSHFYTGIRQRLTRIAPVHISTINAPNGRPYVRALTETAELGSLLGRAEAARTLIDDTEAAMERHRRTFRNLRPGPILLVNMGDTRHVRTFGADSLFGSVLERLDLANAWTDRTQYRASATIGIERLAETPEATLVVVEPTPPGVEPVLTSSPLWRALPSVRAGALVRLPAVNPFGGLPAATRFADLLSRHLTGGTADG